MQPNPRYKVSSSQVSSSHLLTLTRYYDVANFLNPFDWTLNNCITNNKNLLMRLGSQEKTLPVLEKQLPH